MMIACTRRCESGIYEKHEDQEVEDPCKEFGRVWEFRCPVVAAAVGVLGTIPKQLAFFMALLDISLSVEMIQKTEIFGTSQILREVYK